MQCPQRRALQRSLLLVLKGHSCGNDAGVPSRAAEATCADGTSLLREAASGSQGAEGSDAEAGSQTAEGGSEEEVEGRQRAKVCRPHKGHMS